MLRISQLKRALGYIEQFGNPSDFDTIQDNNVGKPNQPGTRAARILDAQKEVEGTIDQEDLTSPEKK